MATFVLVPGAWKGSWSFEAVVPLLERAGHTVHALTLTGLGPDDDYATVATANLDTHADDVLRHLDRAHITDATLVGHSYAGMVVAAAADRAGGRISRLVHLDAYVPRDGESCWSSTNEHFRNVFAAGAAATGYAVRPPGGGDPRRRPHPLASFLQTIRLTGALAQVPVGSSSTARDGRTGRRSLNSAPGSKPIPSGRSTTSPPATTPCTRPRRRSPHYCSAIDRRRGSAQIIRHDLNGSRAIDHYNPGTCLALPTPWPRRPIDDAVQSVASRALPKQGLGRGWESLTAVCSTAAWSSAAMTATGRTA